MAITAAVISTAADAYGQHQASKAAQRANKDAGKVDMSSWRDPWNERFLNRGKNWADKAGIFSNQTAEMMRRGYKGGFGGPSKQGQEMADWMRERAMGGHPLYDPANQYVQGTLGGQTQNPFMQGTYDQAAQFAAQGDPRAQQYMDMLFAGEGLGGGQFGQGGGRGGVRISGGGGAGGYDMRQYLDQVLKGERAQASTAGMQDVIRRQSQQDMEAQLRTVNDMLGSGAGIGGSAHALMGGEAASGIAREQADRSTQLELEMQRDADAMYSNALNTGTQYDLGLKGIGAQQAGMQADAAFRNQSLQQQGELARMGMLGDVIGQNMNFRQGGLQGMGGMAGLMSADQQFALGMVPELSGMDIRDMEAAYGMQSDIDRQRGAAAGRRQKNFYDRMFMPLQYLQQAGGAYQSMWGPYDVHREQGMDRRNQQMVADPGVNWGAAVGTGIDTYGYGKEKGWGKGYFKGDGRE